ncbi:hypothetical protein C8035_v010123 [Colletotrichum spinosum]|uniref:Uncharacterized protein n=1 Tax=Colletotrichum spinosum TaxID=1347390 RepID=A0A4R8QBX6_9PEZI|nr:hypothetical protein C8035_v010123 [Colletotrichum spinosum]
MNCTGNNEKPYAGAGKSSPAKECAFESSNTENTLTNMSDSKTGTASASSEAPRQSEPAFGTTASSEEPPRPDPAAEDASASAASSEEPSQKESAADNFVSRDPGTSQSGPVATKTHGWKAFSNVNFVSEAEQNGISPQTKPDSSSVAWPGTTNLGRRRRN